MIRRDIIIVAFGEMDLSPFAYWSVIATGLIFLLCFALASIPLAKNLKNKKQELGDIDK
tara:strand:- start:762 stop:938 length:177 start_codon:yes stop_codon:yes gene_type:complete